MHLTRRRPSIDINDSWVHVTSVGADVDLNWMLKSLPSTPFSTPPDEKELEDLFKATEDIAVSHPIAISPRKDDHPRGDSPQLIGQRSLTPPKPGGNRPLHATCGPKVLAFSVAQALAWVNRIATGVAAPDFGPVVGQAPLEPASETFPTSSSGPEGAMSRHLLSPISNKRACLSPIQVPQLDSSSGPGTPISDELPTPSSTQGHGVVVSPLFESPLSERLQEYIATYLSAIPIENMRTLETILEDDDDDDESDTQSEHTIVPKDKEKIPDTPVTQSSIYSFHTAIASIPTSPISLSELDERGI
ncbi:hypothetical protein OPQ81_011265 [Rhizoctonia solani]|nr:hypothetical protein OPQ81_011265 [Rhizoctonia solani]